MAKSRYSHCSHLLRVVVVLSQTIATTCNQAISRSYITRRKQIFYCSGRGRGPTHYHHARLARTRALPGQTHCNGSCPAHQCTWPRPLVQPPSTRKTGLAKTRLAGPNTTTVCQLHSQLSYNTWQNSQLSVQ